MQWGSASKACSALKPHEGLRLLGLPEEYDPVRDDAALSLLTYTDSLPGSMREVCSWYLSNRMHACRSRAYVQGGAGVLLMRLHHAAGCHTLVCKQSTICMPAQQVASWQNVMTMWVQGIPRWAASGFATIDDLFNHFARDFTCGCGRHPTLQCITRGTPTASSSALFSIVVQVLSQTPLCMPKQR